MTKKRSMELKVRVTYEPNRLSHTVLADAYQALTPSIMRTLLNSTETKKEPIETDRPYKEVEQQ